MINLPFPNKSFLHKQLLDQHKSFDFTLWDALLTISNDRISLFYGILAENKTRLDSLMNAERISRTPITFPEKIRNYFMIRKILNDIYCHIHMILLMINCIFEGVFVSKHNKNFAFNLEKNSFKRFMDLTVFNFKLN